MVGSRLALTVACLVASVAPAQGGASSWVLLTTTEQGDKRYVTDDEPYTTSTGTRTLATRITFANKRPMQGRPVDELQSIEEFDCARQRTRTVLAVFYFSDGTRKPMRQPTPWRPIATKSLAAQSFAIACSENR